MATQSHTALEPSTKRISQSLPDLTSSKRPSESETLTITTQDNIQLHNMAGREEDTPNSQRDSAQLDADDDSEDHVYDDIISRETDMAPDLQPADNQDDKIDMAQKASNENIQTSTTQRVMYPNVAYNARYESGREDVGDFKKLRTCNGCVLCCFAVILMLVASLAVAGAGMGGYAVYTLHSENTALKEQLLQLSQMPLTDIQIKGFVALEVSRQLRNNLKIANLTAKLDILELQQNTNTNAIEEQKTVLAELEEDSERFQNEIFAELSTELNKSRMQVEQVQQELNVEVARTSELSHQLNYTQQLVEELNSTTHLMIEQLNVTQRDYEQLKSKVAKESQKLDEAQSVLVNKTNEIQNELTKEFAKVRESLNTTKKALAADIADVNSTQEELSLAIEESFKNLSNGLDALSLQSTLQLRGIHANLSERIALNEANISALSEDLSDIETELTSELLELSSQTQNNFTQLRHSLTLAINRTETNIRTDLEAYANATDLKIATLEQAVATTNELLQNQTDELRLEFNNELAGTRGELNRTEEQLSSDIASVNSTLLEFSLTVQESLNNVSIELDTQTIQNTRQLRSVYANLSEQITLNEVHIETLSENQTNSHRALTTELHQLSIRTQNNISLLEHSLMVASNTSAYSLNTFRTKVLQERNLTRASVDALRGNTTDQLATLSKTITGVEGSLREKIRENGNEILSLTLEAQQNHTHLQTAISNNHRTMTNRLHTLQETITREVEQVTNRVGGLDDSLSNTKQDVLRFEENIREVDGRTRNLESSKNRISTDLQSLHRRVENYHSGVSTTMGSKTLTCLFAMITMLVICFYN